MKIALNGIASGLMVASLASQSMGLEVLPLLTDVGAANVFADGSGPVQITRKTFNFNTVRQFSYKAGVDGGGGFVIPISNGENGRNVTAGVGNPQSPNPDVNTDVDNPTPVGLAIAAVNNGGRIQNGNAFRFSVWIQQDPDHPIVIEPSVEPILKFELWSEAQSVFADYNGLNLYPEFGDRLWDTDINGRNSYFSESNQSQSSAIDVNNDGDSPSGAIPQISVPPAVGEQWLLASTTIVIDDTPDDFDPTAGWKIAGVDYFVDSIEEIRATFFTGEFTGQAGGFANGGNFFVDNALLEIFATEADMLAVPVPPNPMPRGIAGDFDQDVDVDGADVLTWQRGYPLLFSAADLTTWRAHFGESSQPAMNATILAYARAVPEPGGAWLATVGCLGVACCRRRRRV